MVAPVVISRIQNRRGTQDQFEALYPPGYLGIGGAAIEDYPEILLPGEVALCTDSRRVFMGNINGEYVELALGSGGNDENISLLPLSILLPAAATYTLIPELTFSATPFFTILYSITDSGTSDWNITGTTFSRNGQLKITSTDYFAPIPNLPYPPIESVNLIDDGVEVNTTASLISFKAVHNLSNIDIYYKHNFASTLTLSTSSIRWIPF